MLDVSSRRGSPGPVGSNWISCGSLSRRAQAHAAVRGELDIEAFGKLNEAVQETEATKRLITNTQNPAVRLKFSIEAARVRSGQGTGRVFNRIPRQSLQKQAVKSQLDRKLLVDLQIQLPMLII